MLYVPLQCVSSASRGAASLPPRRTSDTRAARTDIASCGEDEMARRDSRPFLVGLTLLALTAGPAAAQDATRDPARQYPLPTYEENWQFLSDPNRHADPWDA